MNFTEKLRRLTANRNKSEVGRLAGLTSTAISDYLQKGYVPRADNGIRLAKALGVSPDWLFDDEMDWPAIQATESPPPSALTDDELMLEVAKRYRLAAARLAELLDYAENEADWQQIAYTLCDLSPADPLPDDLRRAIDTARFFPMLLDETIDRYDAGMAADARHSEMPGAKKSPERYDPIELRDRMNAIWDRNKKYIDFISFAEVLRMSFTLQPARRDQLEKTYVSHCEAFKKA